MPPGRVGLPFLGSIADFANLNKLINNASIYGAIHLVHYGFRDVCFINDSKLANKYFSTTEFSDREEKSADYPLPLIDVSVANSWHHRRK